MSEIQIALQYHISQLEAVLRQAREALANAKTRQQCVNAVAAIDAVLSGAPVKELSDERILEIGKEIEVILFAKEMKRAPTKELTIAFARAVLKEGK